MTPRPLISPSQLTRAKEAIVTYLIRLKHGLKCSVFSKLFMGGGGGGGAVPPYIADVPPYIARPHPLYLISWKIPLKDALFKLLSTTW